MIDCTGLQILTRLLEFISLCSLLTDWIICRRPCHFRNASWFYSPIPPLQQDMFKWSSGAVPDSDPWVVSDLQQPSPLPDKDRVAVCGAGHDVLLHHLKKSTQKSFYQFVKKIKRPAPGRCPDWPGHSWCRDQPGPPVGYQPRPLQSLGLSASHYGSTAMFRFIIIYSLLTSDCQAKAS